MASPHLNPATFHSTQDGEHSFERQLTLANARLFQEKRAPYEAIGVNASYMENVYAQAYQLYNSGKYVDAGQLFRLLMTLDPMEIRYALGLAASFHQLHDYRDAINTYLICNLLDAHNPIPHYHASDCFLQLNDIPSAVLSLQLAIEQASTRPEHTMLKERAHMTLQSLKQRVSAEGEPLSQQAPERE